MRFLRHLDQASKYGLYTKTNLLCKVVASNFNVITCLWTLGWVSNLKYIVKGNILECEVHKLVFEL